jgi:hypothetical protein
MISFSWGHRWPKNCESQIVRMNQLPTIIYATLQQRIVQLGSGVDQSNEGIGLARMRNW